jgi:hypothetical protein
VPILARSGESSRTAAAREGGAAMILTVLCPECEHEWDVRDDAIRQAVRGATAVIQCPKCHKWYNVGPLRASGFIVRKDEKNQADVRQKGDV